MVTEELLRDKLEEVESYEELMVELESRATEPHREAMVEPHDQTCAFVHGVHQSGMGR